MNLRKQKAMELEEVAFEEKVHTICDELLKVAQVDCPVTHHFAPGLYIREVFLPAGIIAIGHWQKTEHYNICLQGRVQMMYADGTSEIIEAGASFTSPPGRKVSYVHEDVVWQNVYATEETDVEVLEATYLDKHAVWHKHNDARETMVLEYAKQQAPWKNPEHRIPLPHGKYKAMVWGERLVASGNYNTGEIIGPMQTRLGRTGFGRALHCTETPNAALVRQGDTILILAIQPITGNKGGFQGDEITVDYQESLVLITMMEDESCQVYI